MDRIGIRELRQHASQYLARVASGETIEVTDRGRPVAMLIPAPADPWLELVARGEVVTAREPGEVGDDPPADYGIAVSERLMSARQDER